VAGAIRQVTGSVWRVSRRLDNYRALLAHNFVFHLQRLLCGDLQGSHHPAYVQGAHHYCTLTSHTHSSIPWPNPTQPNTYLHSVCSGIHWLLMLLLLYALTCAGVAGAGDGAGHVLLVHLRVLEDVFFLVRCRVHQLPPYVRNRYRVAPSSVCV
jgi:hypothetical protein